MPVNSKSAAPRSTVRSGYRKSVDDYFDVIRPIVQGVAATFGRTCEVVLHDYRNPEHSIVALAGDVTHRHIGGSVTEIGLGLISQGNEAQNQINYITRTQDGRVLKSTTIVLRDPEGQVFGALCINFDITDLRMVGGALQSIIGDGTDTPEPIAFSDDIAAVIASVINAEELRLGRPINRLNKQDRLALFRALDERGIFALQRSVPQVSECLGISRATVYNYLDEIRADARSK